MADSDPTGSEIIANGLGYDCFPIVANNWIDKQDSDYLFVNQKRRGPVTEIIVHETVTRSHDATVRVLKPASSQNPGGRGLGVHFIVEADGVVYQHGDVVTDLLWHASQHNGPSVGIEVVNPYQPNLLNPSLPWKTTVKAPWAVGGAYVVPTLEQCEALTDLICFLTAQGGCEPVPGLTIPLIWRGLHEDKMALGRVPGAEKCAPGIYAHQYFEHGDGSALVLYAWMRMALNLGPNTAYEEMIHRITGASGAGADISDLLP